ncbi:MAG: terminase small subunit [Eubacteriales bacterium]
MGRFIKYRSSKDFSDAVDRYFDGITYTENARRPDTWVSGKYVPGDEIIGNDGKPIPIIKYAVPPSITSLQCYLGISRQTWSMYAQREGYKDVIEIARMRVESYLTQQLVLMGRDCKGIIFSLENNFGYSDREKLRNDSGNESRTETGNIPALEKLELLKEIAKAYGAMDVSGADDASSGTEDAEDLQNGGEK